ncbi:MAG: lipopolysaccharide assembly protein LapA domain-containing protein, partial [Rhodocyclaceae bacterium]|nr:lipopolysaccharide assembly protein LapA domain-containing protein [Rhodocyclaceae bacterium]
GSLAIVLLLALGLGALITALLSFPSVIRGQWTLARLRRQIADLERDVAEHQRRNSELAAELARLAPAAGTTEPKPEKPYVGLRALLAGTEAVKPSADPPPLRDESSR